MSNIRIDSPVTAQTQSATTDPTAETTSSSTKPAKTEADSQSASRTAGAMKQHASEIKGQQNMAAQLVKKGLEKQLGKLPGRVITLDKNAGNDKLAQINVQREVQTNPPKTQMTQYHGGSTRIPEKIQGGTRPGDETVTTRYPNGVGFKTKSVIEPDGEHILTSVSIEAPVGGRVEEKPGGVSVIMDADGKEVGRLVSELDKEGNMKATMIVHTKKGEYTQNEDGQITFHPKAAGK